VEPAIAIRPDIPATPETSNRGDWLGTETQRRLLIAFLLLGIIARCLRYWLRFPLWEDECFLCINFTSRDYVQLLDPLGFHQVAPPLFLWIELTLVKLLGFNELALRLFPFACSMAGLFLFHRFAASLLRGLPLIVAVAVFACAYPCIRYTGEAKQYASDQLVALVLLNLLVDFWRRPDGTRTVWALAALVAIAIWLSYPAVFVAGGVSLVVAVVLWRGGYRHGWRPWLAYNLLLAGSFALLLLTSVRTQSEAELGFMNEYWQDAFVPVTSPWQWPGWLLRIHTGDLLAYPAGGPHGGSVLPFLAFVTGIWILVHRGRWQLLLLATAPFMLNMVAAAWHRYPYGGHFKFAQHLSPFICLLVGLGWAEWVRACGRRPRLARALLVGALLLPAMVALGCVVRDVLHPYKTLSDQRARAFAQWFWFAAEFEGEAVCLKSDWGLDFSEGSYRELSWSAMFLCNRAIYSPRASAGVPPSLDDVTPTRPLRCILYHDPDYPCDDQAVDRWLRDMEKRFRLVNRERYALPRLDKRDEVLIKTDHLEIFRFVPRET
jgi:hypothetical protein